MPSIEIETLKKELNTEQFKAVTTLNGSLLIIAGAGSGKTRVITFRIAHMLESGIPQSQILALTFTNKAAKEMEQRIKELTGKKLQNLTVSTFHAFGVKILRQDIDKLGWRENFSIYDETDRNQLIKETGRELGFSADALDVYNIGTLFSNIKTGRKTWEHANDQYRNLYEGYQEGLKLFNAVDFDDLIGLPIRLFREHPDVLEKYRNRYKYIMVDEFQDTSRQQYELVRMIADKNIAVVGDDDQSIYSWRGANYGNILMFEEDFPDVTEIRLEQNYRSTETILEAANGVISHNTNRKEKALWSGNGSGRPIEIFMPENENAEADFISETIQGMCATENLHYDAFGVLIRANNLSRAIEESFLAANIPYTMSGGTSFFQRKEIKDIISYLRVIANHDDDINLLRIINTPRRGIGRKTIEQLNETAKAQNCSLWTALNCIISNPPSALGEKVQEELGAFAQFITEQRAVLLGGKGLAKKVRTMVEQIQYWDYLVSEYQKSEKAARFKFMNIESLISSMENWENNPDTFDSGLYAYLNRVTLLSRDDAEDDSIKGKVHLMTIHASKGLEFPVVFIAGAEDGIIPHARSIEDGDGGTEEERRLFYVAITRARDKLFISSCRKRRKMQSITECVPSPFLDEIPAHLVEYHEPQGEPTDDMALDIITRMKMKFPKPQDEPQAEQR
ncbi:MAG: UvrD-helicase domain-containing protein [Bacteroides sp.]|nr:UvrD-helicase domain-containing protein [Prevotella sp.]MCM1407380.1 UvrD-helicase domain-containing protein [Treponema brennaborense]MCM1469870.1 UvrD-helicase domain-containing protein [Bacteroides sp.]